MELLDDVRQVSAIGYGFMASKTLFAALDLALFTHLGRGELTADELQRRTGAPANSLATLLRACASLGLVGVDGDHYRNSPAAAQYLDRGSARYFGDYFLYQIDRQLYPCLQDLRDAVRGRATRPLYERMVADAAEAELFSNAQHVGSLGAAHLLAQRVDASGWSRLLDVAGGSGAFSITLCRRHPALRATILDFDTVVPVARRYIGAAGLGDRIDTLAGNALEAAWPQDVDAVLMSYLLSALPAHAYPALLARAHAALRPGGTLLVHDFMLDETRHGPRHAALWFVANLVSGPGQVSFSAGDLATLLRDARFAPGEGAPLLPGITSLLVATRRD